MIIEDQFGDIYAYQVNTTAVRKEHRYVRPTNPVRPVNNSDAHVDGFYKRL